MVSSTVERGTALAENPFAGAVLDGGLPEGHAMGAVDRHHPLKLRRAATTVVEYRTATAVRRRPDRW